MPERSLPFTGSGGYVHGQRTDRGGDACFGQPLPNGHPAPEVDDLGRQEGVFLLVDSDSSRCPANKVPGSRRRKSKMPCAPGFTPVANVDQATGASAGGCVVADARESPLRGGRSRARFRQASPPPSSNGSDDRRFQSVQSGSRSPF